MRRGAPTLCAMVKQILDQLLKLVIGRRRGLQQLPVFFVGAIRPALRQCNLQVRHGRRPRRVTAPFRYQRPDALGKERLWAGRQGIFKHGLDSDHRGNKERCSDLELGCAPEQFIRQQHQRFSCSLGRARPTLCLLGNL